MSIILVWSWSLAFMSNIHEIRFFTDSNSWLINVVVLAGLFDQILDRQILMNSSFMSRHKESFIFTLWKLEINKLLIIRRWSVSSYGRRCNSLKINCSLWKPGKFISRLKSPFRVCFFTRIHNVIPNQNRKIIVSRAVSI